MTLSIAPLEAPVGAVVSGLDLLNVSAKDTKVLNEAFLKYHVLVIRGQQLSDDELVAFGTCFGPLENARMKSPLASRAEIMVISNIRENGETMGALPDGELSFHFDRIHQKVPNKAGVLHAVEIPTHGGETCFGNMCLAYDKIPNELKRILDGRLALNTFEYGATQPEKKRITPETPQATHPVIRTVPETGEKALFVCRLMTDKIIGLPEDESRHILNELSDLAEDPSNIYEHRWEIGDTLIWDNRCTIHARMDFPSDQRRLMKRVTVSESVPPAH